MVLNKTTRSALSVMGLFVLVGALWAVIGYVYSDHSTTHAALWGGTVMVAGWLLVVIAWVAKYVRILARRRRSNDETGE